MSLAAVAAGCAGTVALSTVARRAGAIERARTLTPGRSRLPRAMSVHVSRALHAAAVDLEPQVAVQLWLLGSAVSVGLGAALAPGLAAPAGVVVLVAGPVGLHLSRHRASRRVEVAVPALLERVAAELRAGGTVERALESAPGDGALGPDLRALQRRLRLGAGLAVALAAWAAERDAPGVRDAAAAFAIAASSGGAAAEALDGLAASLRDRIGVAAEARALATQARVSAVVMLVVPFAHLALSAVGDPSAVGELIGSPIGRVCLVGGVVLDGLAALWMRRIVRVRP